MAQRHMRRDFLCLSPQLPIYASLNSVLISPVPNIYDLHDDVMKWKHFPRYWPFVREIHRSPVNFPHKGQWRGALMFSLIYAWINDWVNNREAGDLRPYRGHYDVIVMCLTARSSPVPQIVIARPHLLFTQRCIYVPRHEPLSLRILCGKYYVLSLRYWLFSHLPSSMNCS